MIIQPMYLTPNKYSRPQTPLKKVTKIAVHYIGNPNTSALANRNYFESLKDKHLYASSHYIIGLNGEIIQCIPESEISYATNQANNYSISIECCHPDSTGKFNDKTLQSLLELCVDICKRHNLTGDDIIRHYDVTGKKCPLYWVNHPEEFKQFKYTVNKILKGDELTVSQYQELKNEINKINDEIESNKEKIFNTIDEVPDWARPTIQKLIDNNYIQGTDTGLNLTYTLLRVLVINDRTGVYEHLE